MRKIKFLVILAVAGLSLAFLINKFHNAENLEAIENQEVEQVETTYTKSLEITEGSTFGKLMADASISPAISGAIFNATEDVYDLTKVRLGRTIDLVFDKETDELEQLIYQIDTEEKLFVTRGFIDIASSTGTTTQSVWAAERKPIVYDIKIKTAEGIIESSMYEAALEKGIDERAVIGFANAFQWTIDFAWEVRKGDSFKFVYEERYLDGEYIMPGQILAGKFVNDGKELYAFYYEESQDNFGYFDENGDSSERTFLKAPVAFKYISSGFTTGQRYISAFGFSTTHRAIDYAADYGTPIRSVGDGTIIFAGWNGSYGYMVKVRHNSTYQTNYGHMSKMAVSYGQKVSQGETIGYVGSTGLSTGPHVHYELVKNGVKINPLTEVFPPKEGIKEENKKTYLSAIADLRKQLDE